MGVNEVKFRDLFFPGSKLHTHSATKSKQHFGKERLHTCIQGIYIRPVDQFDTSFSESKAGFNLSTPTTMSKLSDFFTKFQARDYGVPSGGDRMKCIELGR